MSSAEEKVASGAAPQWPAKDIAYVAVVGSIMVAAFLEWFLWLAAFLYCLCKAYQKAETFSVKLLAVIITSLFTILRLIFLPVMVVTLPLPRSVTRYFPLAVVDFLQWFAFWSFAALLIIPWLFCVYQVVTKSVDRKSRLKDVLDEHTAPKVVIVMPCYNEEPDILLRTVDSLADCDYPPSCLHIFLSFDGDQENELYLNSIEKLGVPLTRHSYPRSIDIAYRSTRVTVSRFQHGGKRSCQKKTFKLIDKVYADYLEYKDDLFVLFIDSDCILDRHCIQNFMYEMELKPGSSRNMLAMTGVITSTTEKNTLITLLQDMEYVHGQLFERSVESGCGAVTCLPGALTILRFSAFRKMARYYFADKAEQCDDLFDYGKCHLGEDRWLTHLFMVSAKKRYQIQMNTRAFCKTEAVQTFRSLLKQRRRWFLGFITNEVCMLTDIRLWKRYPLLCLIRFAQNTIRTTALLFFIMVVALLTTSQTINQLPTGFIAVSLGLNWLLMLYFGAKLGRYKIMLYPLMFLVNPFFNWLYMVYGIFTAGQRTWGGPRADAAKADATTTPAAAIAQAEEQGDDLNIVPETFKPAIDRAEQHSSLQPEDKIFGLFAPAEELPNGHFSRPNASMNTLLGLPTHPSYGPRLSLHPRSSFESLASTGSAGTSVCLPRRVESFVDVDDIRAYHAGMAAQAPPGGAYFETSPYTPPQITFRHGRKPSQMRTKGTGGQVSPLVQALDLHQPNDVGLRSTTLPDLHVTAPSPTPPSQSSSAYPPSAYYNRSSSYMRGSSPGRHSTSSQRSSLSIEMLYVSPSAILDVAESPSADAGHGKQHHKRLTASRHVAGGENSGPTSDLEKGSLKSAGKYEAGNYDSDEDEIGLILRRKRVEGKEQVEELDGNNDASDNQLIDASDALFGSCRRSRARVAHPENDSGARTAAGSSNDVASTKLPEDL